MRLVQIALISQAARAVSYGDPDTRKESPGKAIKRFTGARLTNAFLFSRCCVSLAN